MGGTGEIGWAARLRYHGLSQPRESIVTRRYDFPRVAFVAPRSMSLHESTQQALDRQLVVRAAGGDQTAFAALYDRLSGPLYALCLRMIGDAITTRRAPACLAGPCT